MLSRSGPRREGRVRVGSTRIGPGLIARACFVPGMNFVLLPPWLALKLEVLSCLNMMWKGGYLNCD